LSGLTRYPCIQHEPDLLEVGLNDTAPGGKHPLPPLTRAGIAHLHFVCVHPFEDGNGRIGRALAEKSLAQNLGQPSLIALAYTIERKRKDYYAALERNNKEIEITGWLRYFASTVLEAQTNALRGDLTLELDKGQQRRSESAVPLMSRC
jgi:Fic family protein